MIAFPEVISLNAAYSKLPDLKYLYNKLFFLNHIVTTMIGCTVGDEISERKVTVLWFDDLRGRTKVLSFKNRLKNPTPGFTEDVS